MSEQQLTQQRHRVSAPAPGAAAQNTHLSHGKQKNVVQDGVVVQIATRSSGPPSEASALSAGAGCVTVNPT